MTCFQMYPKGGHTGSINYMPAFHFATSPCSMIPAEDTRHWQRLYLGLEVRPERDRRWMDGKPGGWGQMAADGSGLRCEPSRRAALASWVAVSRGSGLRQGRATRPQYPPVHRCLCPGPLRSLDQLPARSRLSSIQKQVAMKGKGRRREHRSPADAKRPKPGNGPLVVCDD